MKKLRQKLHKLCAKAGQPVPLLAFERWQFNCKLHESLLPAPARGKHGGASVDEPLLPVLPGARPSPLNWIRRRRDTGARHHGRGCAQPRGRVRCPLSCGLTFSACVCARARAWQTGWSRVW